MTAGKPMPYILPLLACYVMIGMVVIPTTIHELRLWYKKRKS